MISASKLPDACHRRACAQQHARIISFEGRQYISTQCRDEVEAIVSFWEQLCHQAQKLQALDPFCMSFLQQVRP